MAVDIQWRRLSNEDRQRWIKLSIAEITSTSGSELEPIEIGAGKFDSVSDLK